MYSAGCCRGATGGVGVYWGEASQYNISQKVEGEHSQEHAELVATCCAVEGALAQGIKAVEVHIQRHDQLGRKVERKRMEDCKEGPRDKPGGP